MPAPRSLSQIGDVRERGASFEEWGGVEGDIRKVEMRNGMCRKMIQNGAALKAIVRRESAESKSGCTV